MGLHHGIQLTKNNEKNCYWFGSCRLPYKEPIKNWLTANGFEVKDFGTYSENSADYADFAHPVASGVENKEFEKGILLCGSGQGVCITANKHQGIRAALVWDTPGSPFKTT